MNKFYCFVGSVSNKEGRGVARRVKKSGSIKSAFKAAAAGGTRMPMGHLEEAILRITSSTDAVSINDVQAKLDQVLGGTSAPGAVYVTISRLEECGWVMHIKSEPARIRGGKAMNLYSITEAGWDALVRQESRSQLIASLSGERPVSKYGKAKADTPKR